MDKRKDICNACTSRHEWPISIFSLQVCAKDREGRASVSPSRGTANHNPSTGSIDIYALGSKIDNMEQKLATTEEKLKHTSEYSRFMKLKKKVTKESSSEDTTSSSEEEVVLPSMQSIGGTGEF